MMKSYMNSFPSYMFGSSNSVFFSKGDDTDTDTDKATKPNNEMTGNLDETSDHVEYTSIIGNADLLDLLRRSKETFHSFGRKIFEEIRGKTNCYEGIGKGCFLNRSAMKLVNLDFEFSLIEIRRRHEQLNNTYLTDQNQKDTDIDVDQPLHFSFVDLCGGPGGFIEYIVLKSRYCNYAVTGFGMSLLIDDDSPESRSAMKACNWNISHLNDPPYSVIHNDKYD